MKKILITTKPLEHEGGVANYYRIFFKKFKSNEYQLVLHIFGSRMDFFYSPMKKILFYPFYFFSDFIRFIYILTTDSSIRIVQVSPSLILVPLVRDALILLGAKLFGRSVIVFFRGWRDHVVQYLKSHFLLRWLFCLIYRNADLTIVFSSRFRDDLVSLGWNPSSIKITTTLYEAEEILPLRERFGNQPRFLYLGRISEMKGIGELIEAARILAELKYSFEFVLVGHGDRTGIVETYERRVQEYGMEAHFYFTGRLIGREKYQAFADSDIYVFPSWAEGCPNSVLEALGSGLFVISTDVGALKDIIIEGQNGAIVRCQDAKDLAEKLTEACENIDGIRARRKQIQNDALNLYESNIIIQQFKRIYHDMLK